MHRAILNFRMLVGVLLLVGVRVGVVEGLALDLDMEDHLKGNRVSEPIIAEPDDLQQLDIDETILDFFQTGMADNMKSDIPGEPLNPNDFTAAAEPLPQYEWTPEQSKIDPIELAALFEGDIETTQSELFALKDTAMETPRLRNAMIDMTRRWERGVVPYVISSAYSTDERGVIAKAMLEYHSKTCIRFVPRTSERDYIHILKGDGCSSAVGRSGGAQQVSLGTGCIYVGIVMHELMHAAGFWHEQSRADRDNYITIVWSNIMAGMSYNFDKYNWDKIQNLGVGYDTGSIMHYGPYAFAKDRNKPTIISSQQGIQLGQRNGFSSSDLKKLNTLYGCTASGGIKPTVITTTTPITPAPPAQCIDSNQYCGQWAGLGECDNNPSWMSVNCVKACNKCGEDCKDQNQYCQYWKGNGECVKNPSYMGVYCKKSCNACHSSTQVTTECEDLNEHCVSWTRLGQCTVNPTYMLVYCKKSCTRC